MTPISEVSFTLGEHGDRSAFFLDADMRPKTRVTLALLLLDALWQTVSDPSLICPHDEIPNARAVRDLGNVCEMLLRSPDTRPSLAPPEDGALGELASHIKRMQGFAVTGYSETRIPPTWEKQRDDLQGCYAIGEELLARIAHMREEEGQEEKR